MIEFLEAFTITPFVDMADKPIFFAQVLLRGLLSGSMYSLVALGFALIFKASGVFNFSQGIMVVFAGLCLVTVWEMGVPIYLAVLLTVFVMIGMAFGVERLILRPLVNQEQITLFMATIGLTFFLQGFGELVFGGQIKLMPLAELGVPEGRLTFLADQAAGIKGIRLQARDLTAAVVAAVLVGLLVLFFKTTKIGRALRAVADDHQAAQSVGIPLKTIWIFVWSVAGIVALVAGIFWGGRSGVTFGLAIIALKALPVLILGGFTSVPGVIVGGLIIGIGEKLGEVYWSDAIGQGIQDWFAYAIALVFLVFRPQGLFGEKIIERV